MKIAYCDSSEQNWDMLSHPASTCFGYSVDMLAFQGINPKETPDILPYAASCCNDISTTRFCISENKWGWYYGMAGYYLCRQAIVFELFQAFIVAEI